MKKYENELITERQESKKVEDDEKEEANKGVKQRKKSTRTKQGEVKEFKKWKKENSLKKLEEQIKIMKK